MNHRSRSDVGYLNSREYVSDCMKKFDCQFYGSKVQMGRDLDSHDLAMRNAGYNGKQIVEYWEEILYDPQFCDSLPDYVEMFIKKGFAVVFHVAEDITKENRLMGKFSGISLGLLRQISQQEIRTIKDWDAKRSNPDANGETYSQLLLYDPNYYELRRGQSVH